MRDGIPIVVLAGSLAMACCGVSSLGEGGSDRPEMLLPSAIEAKLQALADDCDLALLGTVIQVWDGRPRDGGMSYELRVEEVLTGALADGGTAVIISGGRAPSAGWGLYAKGERCLFFVSGTPDRLRQLKPFVYLSDPAPEGTYSRNVLDLSSHSRAEERVREMLRERDAL